jgi:hypothetical protein
MGYICILYIYIYGIYIFHIYNVLVYSMHHHIFSTETWPPRPTVPPGPTGKGWDRHRLPLCCFSCRTKRRRGRWLIHRTGWWENLQESPIFDGKNHGFL